MTPRDNEELQEGAPSAGPRPAAGASAGVPSRDSPELAAIRAKIPAMATADSGWPEVHALINMVDDLRATVERIEFECQGWRRKCVDYARDTDELRAKLAEAEKPCASCSEWMRQYEEMHQFQLDETQRVEAAEARVKELERKASMDALEKDPRSIFYKGPQR